MKNCLITLLAFFIPVALVSQEGFKEGYVLLTQQDTLYGLIENNSGYKNSAACNFRKSLDDTVSHFSPDEIFGYYFNEGKYYVSKDYENQRSFYEFLVEGRLSVFFKQDKDLGNHYFIERDSLPFRELTYKSGVTVDEDGIQRVTASRTHNQLLSYYTSDYPQLKKAAMSIEKPGNSSLIRFAKEYHNATCVDEPCLIYEKKVKPVLELEFIAGASHIFADTAGYIPGKTFGAGALMLNVMVPKISESIYFGVGLGYYKYPEHVLLEKEFLYTHFADSIFRWVYETRFQPGIQIPFTVFYNNHRPGISPILGLSTNLLYVFDFRAFCGLNFQKDLLAVKLLGEFGMFPTVSARVKTAGVKISLSRFLK
jgi:hypothetical protein